MRLKKLAYNPDMPKRCEVCRCSQSECVLGGTSTVLRHMYFDEEDGLVKCHNCLGVVE
jgi:hypothetical protein